MVDLKNLSAPFPPESIEWRIGSMSKDKTKGMALAYINARDVQDRLDAVCGVGGWQNRFPHVGEKTVCEIGIFVNGEWIWKADGAGDTDFEAEKGALSDAFKRSAVKWGIGRYLYDLPAPWVAIDQFKKIPPHELERLRSLLVKDGLKVGGLSGISKTTAKFWEKENLTVCLTTSLLASCIGENWSAEAWEWWKEKFSQGIQKAPTRELLAKYQVDNQHILDNLTSQEAEVFRDAFEIRSTQFDQEDGYGR